MGRISAGSCGINLPMHYSYLKRVVIPAFLFNFNMILVIDCNSCFPGTRTASNSATQCSGATSYTSSVVVPLATLAVQWCH